MICTLIVSEQVRAAVFAFLFYKRNKKLVPRALFELYKHLGIFKNTREVRETLACGSCFSSTSLVFLKLPAGLYNSTMHLARFFISLLSFFSFRDSGASLSVEDQNIHPKMRKEMWLISCQSCLPRKWTNKTQGTSI